VEVGGQLQRPWLGEELPVRHRREHGAPPLPHQQAPARGLRRLARAAPGGAPDEAAVRSQQVARLAAALDELPLDLRAAYVLCDLEDMPGVEAARVLDIRAGTLWRRLHEARRALRDAIDGGPR